MEQLARPEEATSTLQERHRQSLSVEGDEAQRNRLQRAAIVGQLAGGILHDFNNVLTVITGMIDILAGAVANEPQLAAIAKLIDEAATRGAALTALMLAFARGRPSKPREVDLNALLADAVRLLRPALGGIELGVAAAIDIPSAQADPDQLMAAVLSLAIAARNAMPEGGRLLFAAGWVRTMERCAVPSASDGDDGALISIDAHGYAEVAGHHEQIFSDIDTALDFIGQCGGHLEISTASDRRARVEILLPACALGASWLAES
jgi:nitrogen-specific signal transduction histidine kinase